MDPISGPGALPSAAADRLGDPEALALLANLVALAPTNLEDPPSGRYEKPNYSSAVDALARQARRWGLATRIYDPVADPASTHSYPGGPRPNLIVDLDVGAPTRVLILAHYDVVPVPAEQLDRWKSPPHTLTWRDDGRLYGRGSNDDLGSGVVGSLLAMKRLARGPPPPRNVRLLLCCDEETGGAGGIEALKHHDDRLPAHDPGRFVAGDVALIPDGSPHVTAASCGVAFLDAGFERPVPLGTILDLGETLASFNDRVAEWRSKYPSPDWPDHGAPAPVITGRATVTKFDVHLAVPNPPPGALLAVHAETEASNQIAESVTLVFAGAKPGAPSRLEFARREVPAPYRVEPTRGTSVPRPAGSEALSVVGRSAHGGYPHAGLNPVPMTFRLLRAGLATHWVDGTAPYEATVAVDLRLIPEMQLPDGLPSFLGWADGWIRSAGIPAHVEAPPDRCRGGYALAPDHPELKRIASILGATLGTSGVFGEYGGTDASSLSDRHTPSDGPMPAIVFGSMDRASQIHQAEESADPALIAGVARTIERFVREA